MTDQLEFVAPDGDAVVGADAINDREKRELLIAQRCGRNLGIFAAETEGIISWKEPSPLPGARPAVGGLVCVRGRMYTVIDPRELAGLDGIDQSAPGFIVLIGGDEQLGLAVERVTSIIEIFVDEIELPEDGAVRPLIRGSWNGPTETITIIDPARIFAAACAEPETC